MRVTCGLAPLCLALACLGFGCGYGLVGSGTTTPVRVLTLENDSLEPGVDLMLAAALRRELERSPSLRLVDNAATGGYGVAGKVVSVFSSGRTFTPGVRALEYTLSVQLDLQVRGPMGRPVEIDPFAEHATEIYLASSDVQINAKNRQEALRRLAGILATRIRRELESAAESA